MQRVLLGAWLRAGEGIGWLAAGTMPNSLYRMPLVYLSLTCVFCYSLFLSLCRLCFCVFLCSHWSLVDVPLIFFCPADHVPDWQPRVLLGMVEARSVNVKKTTTTTHTHTVEKCQVVRSVTMMMMNEFSHNKLMSKIQPVVIDLFLSSRPRTGLATTYSTGYG